MVTITTETEPGEAIAGHQLTCPKCGGSEFQHVWYVASVAPIVVLDPDDEEMPEELDEPGLPRLGIDYDGGEVIWDAVISPPDDNRYECRTCCHGG